MKVDNQLHKISLTPANEQTVSLVRDGHHTSSWERRQTRYSPAKALLCIYTY